MTNNRLRRRSIRCLWLVVIIMLASSNVAPADAENRLRVAAFEVDVTPPLGSPLCNGAVKPAILHTLHQHDAPGSAFATERLLAEHGLGRRYSNPDFDADVMQRVAAAACGQNIRLTCKLPQ